MKILNYWVFDWYLFYVRYCMPMAEALQAIDWLSLVLKMINHVSQFRLKDNFNSNREKALGQSSHIRFLCSWPLRTCAE